MVEIKPMQKTTDDTMKNVINKIPLDFSEKFIVLNNGKKMPALGFGTWLSEPDKVKKAVLNAIEIGYRHIDMAEVYGNEKEIGEALDEALNKKKSVQRDELFLTSKLWSTHFHPDHVAKACKQSIENLKCDYLDLYLLHWPMAFEYTGMDLTKENVEEMPMESSDKEKSGIKLSKVPLYKTWAAMEKLVDDGLVKSIGVCNFPIALLVDLLTYAKIKPVVNQVECHPYMAQNDLIRFCRRLADIRIVGYSPIGHGDEQSPMNDESIKTIAKKYNKNVGQLILKWNIQRGVPVIPKSTSYEHIKSNFQLFDFNISNEDMEAINKLNKNKRLINFDEQWKIDVFE